MTSIDPTLCQPGMYRVLFKGHECDAVRLRSTNPHMWSIETTDGTYMCTYPDMDFEVLSRLVPERTDLQTLRAAVDLIDGRDGAAPALNFLAIDIARREAELAAGQAKAAQDAPDPDAVYRIQLANLPGSYIAQIVDHDRGRHWVAIIDGRANQIRQSAVTHYDLIPEQATTV